MKKLTLGLMALASIASVGSAFGIRNRHSVSNATDRAITWSAEYHGFACGDESTQYLNAGASKVINAGGCKDATFTFHIPLFKGRNKGTMQKIVKNVDGRDFTIEIRASTGEENFTAAVISQ